MHVPAGSYDAFLNVQIAIVILVPGPAVRWISLR